MVIRHHFTELSRLASTVGSTRRVKLHVGRHGGLYLRLVPAYLVRP
jgi:hypothetical protein